MWGLDVWARCSEYHGLEDVTACSGHDCGGAPLQPRCSTVCSELPSVLPTQLSPGLPARAASDVIILMNHAYCLMFILALLIQHSFTHDCQLHSSLTSTCPPLPQQQLHQLTNGLFFNLCLIILASGIISVYNEPCPRSTCWEDLGNGSSLYWCMQQPGTGRFGSPANQINYFEFFVCSVLILPRCPLVAAQNELVQKSRYTYAALSHSGTPHELIKSLLAPLHAFPTHSPASSVNATGLSPLSPDLDQSLSQTVGPSCLKPATGSQISSSDSSFLPQHARTS